MVAALETVAMRLVDAVSGPRAVALSVETVMRVGVIVPLQPIGLPAWGMLPSGPSARPWNTPSKR